MQDANQRCWRFVAGVSASALVGAHAFFVTVPGAELPPPGFLVADLLLTCIVALFALVPAAFEQLVFFRTTPSVDTQNRPMVDG